MDHSKAGIIWGEIQIKYQALEFVAYGKNNV